MEKHENLGLTSNENKFLKSLCCFVIIKIVVNNKQDPRKQGKDRRHNNMLERLRLGSLILFDVKADGMKNYVFVRRLSSCFLFVVFSSDSRFFFVFALSCGNKKIRNNTMLQVCH